MYLSRDLGLSFGVLLGISLLLVGFTSIFYFWCTSKKYSNSVWLKRILGILLCVAVVEILFLFLNAPISTKITTTNGVIIAHVAAAAILCCVVFYFGFKFINTVLFIFIVISVGTLSYSIIAAKSAELVDDPLLSLKLKNKPNIYLFILESYHNLRIQHDVYDINTEPLTNYLQRNDFVAYEDAYSNSAFTLLSMADIFLMRKYENMALGNDDARQEIRLAIGGSKDNTLYRILKNNGYTIKFLPPRPTSYYIFKKGAWLDDIDVEINHIKFSFLYPILNLNDNLQRFVEKRFANHAAGAGSLTDRVSRAMRSGLQSRTPFFICFKGGARHTPGRHNWKEDLTGWLACYRDLVRKSDEVTFNIVDSIIKNDPNSIIILIGDHGPMRFRGIWSEAENGNLADLERVIQMQQQTMDEVADDVFGVLVAVRMPGGRFDISLGHHICHVNLFRHIFAALNDDLTILEDKAPAYSTLSKYVLIKDGVVQHCK